MTSLETIDRVVRALGLEDDRRAQFALRYARRPDLFARVLDDPAVRRRTAVVRSTLKTEGSYTREQLQDDVWSALARAPFRALVDYFLIHAEVAPQWMIDQRSALGLHWRDATEDAAILYAAYPELYAYCPDPEPTEAEVVDAACREFQMLIDGAGTRYRQRKREQYHAGAITALAATEDTSVVTNQEGEEAVMRRPLYDAEFLEVVVDQTAQERVENFDVAHLLESEHDVLGAVLTRAAVLSMLRYGESGLFWLLDFQIAPDHYTELLRTIGGDEALLGKKKFEAVKRELARKLPKVRADMLALCKDDARLQLLDEMLRGETVLERPKLAPTLATLHACAHVENERAASLARRRGKFYQALEADARGRSVREHLTEANDRRWVDAYGACRTEFEWQDLVRKLVKSVGA